MEISLLRKYRLFLSQEWVFQEMSKVKNGTPFYKVSDLGINFKLELERPKNYVTAKQIKNNKWKVIDPTKNGAVVFAKIGAVFF